MKYAYVPMAVQIECKDCEWKSESYKNGQAIAKIHAKRYGHKVRGELTIFFSYDYRGEGGKKQK